MFGRYGEQFMKPAFLLLQAIWQSIFSNLKSEYKNIQTSEIELDKFNEELDKLHKNPIVFSLNKSLIGSNGIHLLIFKKSLEGLNLNGLNRTNLFLNGLSLMDCNMRESYFEHANLSDSKFIRSDLSEANLTKADLSYADLTRSRLIMTNLADTYLFNADLKGAYLWETNFKGSYLLDTDFRGTDIKNSFVNNAVINNKTLFGEYNETKEQWINEDQIREDVLSRGALWDDDPEWLVGKIQDNDLLEKIRNDCNERIKNVYDL